MAAFVHAELVGTVTKKIGNLIERLMEDNTSKTAHQDPVGDITYEAARKDLVDEDMVKAILKEQCNGEFKDESGKMGSEDDKPRH